MTRDQGCCEAWGSPVSPGACLVRGVAGRVPGLGRPAAEAGRFRARCLADLRRQLRRLSRGRSSQGGARSADRRDDARGGESGPAIESSDPERACCSNGSRTGDAAGQGAEALGPRGLAGPRAGSAAGPRRITPTAIPQPVSPIRDEDRRFWSFRPLGGRRCLAGPRRRPVRTPDRCVPAGPAGVQGADFLARRRSSDTRAAGLTSTCWACRPRPRRSTPSWPTTGPAPSSGWSTGCWPRRTSASAGAGTGSTSPATPTPSASTPTRPTSSSAKGNGAIAITSSAPSTRTSPTTGSSPSSSPATSSLTGGGPQHFTPEIREPLIATGYLRTARDLTHEDGGIIPQNFFGIAARHGRDRRHQPAGLDDQLRPLPQPQVRPDPAGGLLPADGRLHAGL